MLQFLNAPAPWLYLALPLQVLPRAAFIADAVLEPHPDRSISAALHRRRAAQLTSHNRKFSRLYALSAVFLSVATTSHLRHDSWLWTSLYGALAVLTGIEAGAWHAFRSTPSDTKNADAANGTGDSESTTPES
ncbi:hypothetical protein NHG22_20260 [Streptomyces sp. ATE26]|uniref:hypothetical protein n=1 Tax=unclassified Streptomyces TaxID=2593676 RepID=UPI00116C20E7|nr:MULTISPECIES: hypothetical protein [unclassified Streptomyces]MDI1456131.1 hypothetical protein [Streptomyces sp. ATE26]GEK01567.1 hypothetical protein TNCT1_38430 [Streptomyces sp. 1-11]